MERNPRYDVQPRVSLRGLWRLAKTAIFSFSSLPLAVFNFLGYAALGVFVGLGGYSISCRLFTEQAIPGWTSHILSASFFGAINALGISMLGEYVIRIYDQVRGRPLYLIDRTVNLSRPGQIDGQSTEHEHTNEAISNGVLVDDMSVDDSHSDDRSPDLDEALLVQALELLDMNAGVAAIQHNQAELEGCRCTARAAAGSIAAVPVKNNWEWAIAVRMAGASNLAAHEVHRLEGADSNPLLAIFT